MTKIDIGKIIIAIIIINTIIYFLSLITKP